MIHLGNVVIKKQWSQIYPRFKSQLCLSLVFTKCPIVLFALFIINVNNNQTNSIPKHLKIFEWIKTDPTLLCFLQAESNEVCPYHPSFKATFML